MTECWGGWYEGDSHTEPFKPCSLRVIGFPQNSAKVKGAFYSNSLEVCWFKKNCRVSIPTISLCPSLLLQILPALYLQYQKPDAQHTEFSQLQLDQNVSGNSFYPQALVCGLALWWKSRSMAANVKKVCPNMMRERWDQAVKTLQTCDTDVRINPMSC